MVDYEGEGKKMPDFKALEKASNPDLPPWAVRQKKVFTSWINNKVVLRNLKVEDLFTDLSDGVVLYNLLEVLSRQSLAVLGRIKPEKNKIKKIANMNIVWKYLGTTVRLVGIGPTDIVDGNSNLTLGMIWSLIVFFMAKDLGDSGEDLAALKKRIMEWLKARTRNHADINIHNFTDSLADGRAFLAVMESVDPDSSPYDPSGDHKENLRRAFKDAERLFGVGSILDPDDPACCSDEKANITYLAELMKVMPEIPSDEDAFVYADPRQSALDYAAANIDKSIDNLRDLCKIQPRDIDGAVSKVSDLMEKAGLKNINVVDDSGPINDSPYIIGERVGPPGGPTVLLYATYATAEDSEAEAAHWYCDPFDGKVEDGRIYAKGVFQDKANVVAPLAAVEALLSNPALHDLPCTLKVLIGGTPPPKSLIGDAPLELTAGLADFLRAHPDEIGHPEFVIVSNPGGSSLVPDHANIGIGCRGFATMKLTVRTFNPPLKDHGAHPSICTYGGPLIDPGCVLASLLASLRDLKTGALLVDTLKVVPDKAVCEKLKGIHYGEHNARFQTGYCKDVPCAKEFFDIDGITTLATIVEQLTLLPAVTITSLKMASDKDYGPLSAEFSPTAEATIHLCLGPDQDVGYAIKALKQHCNNLVSYGVEVEYSDFSGHKGWSVHPSAKIVEALLASRGLADCKRSTIAVGSPEFQPIPCAFSEALPESKVVSFGIHESESNSGLANESILIDDFTDYIKTTVELLHFLAHGPPKPKVKGGSDADSVPGTPPDPQAKYLKSKEDLDRRQAANKLRASLSPVSQKNVLVGNQRGRSSSISRLTLHQTPPNFSPTSFYRTPSPPGSNASVTATGKSNLEGAFKISPPPVPSRQGRSSSMLDSATLATRVFEEINLVRINPAEYARKELEPLTSCFGHGGLFTSPNGSQRVTSEGIKALEDAILVLKRTEPVPPLVRLPELDRSSHDHASDLSASGQTSHVGTDGSRASERINRYGQFIQVAGEMIALYENNPTGIVCQMLINDGEKSRQNRKSILGSHFKVCGLAALPHSKVNTVCVVTLAGGWKPKSLDRPAFVTVAPGETPSAEFRKVMESIPVAQIIEEANKAMEEGNTVEIDYKPGEVKLTVKMDDGSSQLLSCQWS